MKTIKSNKIVGGVILIILLLIIFAVFGVNHWRKVKIDKTEVIVNADTVVKSDEFNQPTPTTSPESDSQIPIDVDSGTVKKQLIYSITKNDVLFYRQQLQLLKDNDINRNIELFESAYSSATFEKNKKLDILVEYKYIGKNSIILDFGCGNGRFTFKFSEIAGKNGRVYAVDRSINCIVSILCLIQRSKQNCDNIIPRINNNYDSGVSENIIDLVFISDVHIFHYDPISSINSEGNNFIHGSESEQVKLINLIDKEWGQLIDSLYRSTKKNGYLVITEYMRCSGSKLRMSEKSVIKLFEKHNFKLEKSFTDSFKEEPIHYIVFKK